MVRESRVVGVRVGDIAKKYISKFFLSYITISMWSQLMWTYYLYIVFLTKLQIGVFNLKPLYLTLNLNNYLEIVSAHVLFLFLFWSDRKLSGLFTSTFTSTGT